MKRFKKSTVILMAFCLMLIFGQQGICSDDDSEMFDYGAYWMPLTEGNTKSFISNINIPGTQEAQGYTKTVTGTEVIKGFEAVKVEITDSDIPFGNLATGSYEALLPDLSEWQTTLKRHIAKDPALGSYYSLSTPFNKIPRYREAPVEGRFFQITAAATCFAENKNILQQRKLVNRPIDSLITIVTIVDLGFEDVTVPAGNFENCLKTHMGIALSYAQNPQNNMSIKTITWAAEGVGTVKHELTEMMFANETDIYPYNTTLSGTISELVSATIDGVSYPQD